MLGLVAVLTAVAGTPEARAQGQAPACVAPSMPTDQRPGDGQGPTRVSVAMTVADVTDISDADQNMTTDIRAVMSWTDPRLGGLEGCRFALDKVWFPPVMLANSANLRQALTLARNQVAVGPGGTVTYVQRYTGEISTYHKLQDFPFDSHVFRILVLAPDLGPDQLQLVAGDARLAQRLNIEGWDVRGVSLSAADQTLPGVGEPRSVLTLGIDVHRQAGFYLFRVLLPLVLVVMMSWAIFWVPPGKYEFQIGLAASSMLSVIAFSLSMSSRLPTLGYLTALDKMLIWAICLVFLSMVQALTTGLLVLKERKRIAERMDMVARVVFPILLLAGWWLAYP